MKIALFGKMRSGKDLVGKVLINEYDFERFAFSKGIQEVIDKYFPDAAAKGKPRKHYQVIGQSLRSLDPDVWVNYILRDIADAEYRNQNCGRSSIVKNVPELNILITDGRQSNECKKLKENGFTIIKVESDEQIRIQRIIDSGDVFNIHELQHETELQVDLIDADIIIKNNGTKEELEREVQRIMTLLKHD